MLNRFDKKIKQEIKENPITAPQDITEMIDLTLAELPDKKQTVIHHFKLRTAISTAAAVIAAVFFILPNVSPNIAYAMENIPVIGSIVKVITIRNYNYRDNTHELEAEIPSIEVSGENSSDAEKYINASVDEMTKGLIEQFYSEADEYGDEAHSSLKISYDVLADNDRWFTLRLNIFMATGSGNTNYKIYHIDKSNGKVVQISDLFLGDGYIDAISRDIQRQMADQMQKNEDIVYWLDAEFPECNFAKIDEDQNFYFTENGDITIVFDKYEVAPGFMGAPEFTVSKQVYEKFLKNSYK